MARPPARWTTAAGGSLTGPRRASLVETVAGSAAFDLGQRRLDRIALILSFFFDISHAHNVQMPSDFAKRSFPSVTVKADGPADAQAMLQAQYGKKKEGFGTSHPRTDTP